MEWSAVVLVCAVVLVATTTQALTGFGFALIAVPVLVTVLDVKDVVVLVSLLGLASSLLVARRTWRQIPMRCVATMLAASFARLVLGLLAATAIAAVATSIV